MQSLEPHLAREAANAFSPEAEPLGDTEDTPACTVVWVEMKAPNHWWTRSLYALPSHSRQVRQSRSLSYDADEP